jgi:DNA-binding winged helix-turn-helix (wHTH) protein/TolB-like protein/Flp pilus assembly protein TadD
LILLKIQKVRAVIYGFGPYRLNTDRLELWCGTDAVAVEPQVFRLLQHLIENRERVVSKDELIDQIWEGRIVSDATVSSRINAARRAVGDSGKAQAVIRTISKRGFRFVAEVHTKPEVSAGQVSNKSGLIPPVTLGPSVPAASKLSGSADHSLVVREFEVDGDVKADFLAKGLRVYLHNSFSRHSTIEVIREPFPSRGRAEFALEGSVRGHGGSLRLTFSLIDRASNSQIWSERFDRSSEDLFELEEEIGRAVSAAVRVKLKDVEFERLKDSVNEELSVADLLNKAAAYFVHGPGSNEVIEAALRTAFEREPNDSMTVAMLSHCLWRGFEFSPLALPETSKKEITDLAVRAVELNAESYFTHLIAAITAQDVLGDFERALRHAQAALEINPDLIGAHGMVGIAKCHLGDPDAGVAKLQQILDTGREDPHRFRHQRELAIASFIAGDLDRATDVIWQLVESEPQMDRNRLIQAALLWLRGDCDDAVAAGRRLRDTYSDLTTLTKRPVWIGQAAAAERFEKAISAIGL